MFNGKPTHVASRSLMTQSIHFSQVCQIDQPLTFGYLACLGPRQKSSLRSDLCSYCELSVACKRKYIGYFHCIFLLRQNTLPSVESANITCRNYCQELQWKCFDVEGLSPHIDPSLSERALVFVFYQATKMRDNVWLTYVNFYSHVSYSQDICFYLSFAEV